MATVAYGLVDVFWVRGTPVLAWILVGAVCGGLWAWRTRRAAAATLAPPVSADITPAILTLTLTVSSKTYDGTPVATITGCILTGVIGADVVGCSTARATATLHFADAGDAIGVEVTGLALTGRDTQLRAREHLGDHDRRHRPGRPHTDTHRQQQDLRRDARRHDHRLQPYRGHRR